MRHDRRRLLNAPDIIVNGVHLDRTQALTVHTAILCFLIDLEGKLGDEKMATKTWREQVSEIAALMKKKNRKTGNGAMSLR